MDGDAQLSVQQRFRVAKTQSLRLLKGSAHTDWMNECVPDLMSYGKDQDVAIAACLNIWRDAWEESHPDGAVDPGPPIPGSEYDKQLQIARGLLKEWDESKHPRVPAGGPDGGEFGPGGGGAAAKPGGGKSKKPAKKEDFTKAKISFGRLTEGGSDAAKAEAEQRFIDRWNEKVGLDPAEFKTGFMGGNEGTMTISAGYGSKINIRGEIQTADAKALGTYDRELDLDKKSAYSAYFKLERSATKHDIGKKMLAGNVDTYQKLGIEKVAVTANIDVGGYAWAKYGYVPTQDAWNSLRGSLERKLGGGISGTSTSNRGDNTIEADDWDMLSSDTQDNVRDEWMRQTRTEFIQSEEQSWRDSGQAKDDAKRNLAADFTNYQVTDAGVPEWVGEALDGARIYREEHDQSPIPYTNRQLYDAVLLEYESRNGDGEDDPEIDFDDKMLQQPIGYDPSQGTLPGIEPIDPATYLTKDMRERITKRMVGAFDKKAEEDAGEMEAPSYLAESVEEYQDEVWSSMDDRERLQHAIDQDMANIEIEPDEDEEEEPQMELSEPVPAEDPLLAAVRSSNPKSIWKVADSPRGKELLLGTGWSGVLNLKDQESMDRFNKYVGRNG